MRDAGVPQVDQVVQHRPRAGLMLLVDTGHAGGPGAVHRHGGQAQPLDQLEQVVVVAVAHQGVALDGDRELDPAAQEGGEGRFAPGEGSVALAERPDGTGRPVRLAGVGGVGVVGRGRGRVQGAVGLHPQQELAGVVTGQGLKVGPGRATAGRPAGGRARSRWPASRAGRPPRRGRDTRLRPLIDGTQPSRSAIPTMRSRVRSDTPSRPFSATDTVLIETPASRATSVMLTRRARSPAGRGLAGIGPAVRAGMR